MGMESKMTPRVRWRRNLQQFDGSSFGTVALAVRWYLRYGLSHRDVEELLAERGRSIPSTGR